MVNRKEIPPKSKSNTLPDRPSLQAFRWGEAEHDEKLTSRSCFWCHCWWHQRVCVGL